MGITARAERRQVALYLVAIAAGAALGLLAPASAPALGAAITPLLALLLFATFLGMPLFELVHGLRDVRFVAVLLVLNFAVAPIVAFALSRLVADDEGLLLGVLLVLLTPCVDYVVVFTGLAGGARLRLLAATPLLLVAQMLLLPGFLWAFGVSARTDPAPFLDALLLLIVLPLGAAALAQLLAARAGFGRMPDQAASVSMVPLMMLTLLAVVGSQVAAIGVQASALLRVVPVYALFLAAMVALGVVAARTARLPVPEARALVFSGATRNSLVVLPLALAAPAATTPLAVVTQTLVELVGLVLLVRIVPRLIPGRRRSAPRRPPA